MWHAQKVATANGLEITLFNNDNAISFETLFHALADDVGFISWYTELLAGCNLVSYFWEHPPLLQTSLSNPAEFMLIDAPTLTGLRADQQSFRDHFAAAGSDPTVVFQSLGGDATLIAPCAIAGTQNCVHLAPFVRAAPADLICAFWQTVGKTVLHSLGDRPLWLSTSGLGVSWLHARLDSEPKYYQHAPYKSLTGE